MSTWYYVINQNIKKITEPDGTKVIKPVGVDIVYQIDIPVGSNSTPKTWRDCVLDRVDPNRIGVISEVPQLEVNYLTQYNKLQSGSALEGRITVNFSSAYLTPQQREAEIEARLQEVEDNTLGELQIEFEWTGRADTVV